MSGFVLDKCGYGFNGIGSLEEYFAYDTEEYYRSLQMGLPALYYSGRDNPPHPEIWAEYFLRMVELYSAKVCNLSLESSKDDLYAALSHLNVKEKEFLFLIPMIVKERIRTYRLSDFTKTNEKEILSSLSGLEIIFVK